MGPSEIGSGYVCHYRTWSLLCSFLLWGPWPSSRMICWHLPSVPPVYRGGGHQHKLGGDQSCHPPTPPIFCHTPTCKDRDTGSGQGRRCACQLRRVPQCRAWPLTVSEGGAQVSLATTVKLKGHASECWGWLLCDLLGTSSYD